MECRAAVVPHPDKIKTGGEDAYCISANKRLAGVADGVGGWTYAGVDPGVYARMLIEGVKSAADQITNPTDRLDLLDILKASFDKVRALS